MEGDYFCDGIRHETGKRLDAFGLDHRGRHELLGLEGLKLVREIGEVLGLVNDTGLIEGAVDSVALNTTGLGPNSYYGHAGAS
jgi:hypothetical protein